jgi:RNA polymerase primary sigma factor
MTRLYTGTGGAKSKDRRAQCRAPKKAPIRAFPTRYRPEVPPPLNPVAPPVPEPPPEIGPDIAEVPRLDATPAAPREMRTMARDGDFSLRMYLREISETPLLTPEEEVELAGRIQRGDAEAREHMIKANLRLVVKIAKDFDGMGLPLLDMINEGNMGLMRAVERFDPTKGAKLSTYAAWWIKQSIKRGLANQGKTIRLPVHLVDRVSKIRRTAMKLHEELEREPTDAEVAEVLGMTAERVTELIQASYRPASLDAPLGDDDDTRVADIVKDENATTAYQDLEATTRQDLVRELVDELDPRELTIISYRFGLDGGPERTLEEVGQKFGVTRERIRQIQNVALNKLRKKIEKREAVRDPEFDEFMRQAA